MVSFLVARVPADPFDAATELVVGPAAGLFRRQLDGLAAAGRLAGTAVREGAALAPGVAVAVAGLLTVVVVSFLVAGLVALAGSVRCPPHSATATP